VIVRLAAGVQGPGSSPSVLYHLESSRFDFHPASGDVEHDQTSFAMLLSYPDAPSIQDRSIVLDEKAAVWSGRSQSGQVVGMQRGAGDERRRTAQLVSGNICPVQRRWRALNVDIRLALSGNNVERRTIGPVRV